MRDVVAVVWWGQRGEGGRPRLAGRSALFKKDSRPNDRVTMVTMVGPDPSDPCQPRQPQPRSQLTPRLYRWGSATPHHHTTPHHTTQNEL